MAGLVGGEINLINYDEHSTSMHINAGYPWIFYRKFSQQITGVFFLFFSTEPPKSVASDMK